MAAKWKVVREMDASLIDKTLVEAAYGNQGLCEVAD